MHSTRWDQYSELRCFCG